MCVFHRGGRSGELKACAEHIKFIWEAVLRANGEGGNRLVVWDVPQCLPQPPGVGNREEALHFFILPLGSSYGLLKSVLCSFVQYFTIYTGFLVGELPDLYGGYAVLNTSTDVPRHILSIVLNIDRRVLPSGCSSKHMSVCHSKTVVQTAFSLWSP